MIDLRASGLGQKLRDVLHQRSGTVHVEALQSVADAEDRLPQLVCVLEEEIVNGVTPRIGGGGLRRLRRVNLAGSTSALLPGSSTPWQVAISFRVSSWVRSSGTRTGSPPASATARSYCGIARSPYSRSVECGMGMAMRGVVLTVSILLVTILPDTVSSSSRSPRAFWPDGSAGSPSLV